MVLLAICLLVGMALGQRCTVFALVPATGVALVVAFGAGTDGVWPSALSAIAAATALQIGYLFETGIQSVRRRSGPHSRQRLTPDLVSRDASPSPPGAPASWP
jgi:hypothetical protein